MSAHGSDGRSEPARAVALRYDGRALGAARDEVPSVVARGQARVAESIVALAREHGIPVREDRDLVALLACCEPGTPIPTELYGAVAELIAWLYRTNTALVSAGRAEQDAAAHG